MNRLPDHQGRLEDYSLTNRIFKNWGDVFTSAHSRHHTSSHVLHRLKFLKINFGHFSQRRIAVVYIACSEQKPV